MKPDFIVIGLFVSSILCARMALSLWPGHVTCTWLFWSGVVAFFAGSLAIKVSGMGFLARFVRRAIFGASVSWVLRRLGIHEDRFPKLFRLAGGGAGTDGMIGRRVPNFSKFHETLLLLGWAFAIVGGALVFATWW